MLNVSYLIHQTLVLLNGFCLVAKTILLLPGLVATWQILCCFDGYVGSSRFDISISNEDSAPFLDLDSEVAQLLQRLSRKDPTTKKMDLWRRSVEVDMFWDLETCPLDPSDNIRVVLENIRRSLKLLCEFYELKKITIVGDTKMYGGDRVFSRVGGNLIVECLPKRFPYCSPSCIPRGYVKEDMSNHRIKLEMFKMLSEHGAPRTMLLATSDPDMPEWITSIKERGCTIMVAHQEYATPDLPLSGTHSVLWSDLKSGPSESGASGSGSNPEPRQRTEVVKPADELKSTELEHEISSGSVEKSVNTADEKNAAEVNNVAADVKNAVAGAATTPLESGKVEHSDKKAVTAQKPTEPVAPQVDGAKRSYASIVQSVAKNNTPFQVKAPAQKPKYLEQPRAAPQKPAYVGNSGKNFDQKIKIIEEPGTSIFVANLPMNAIPRQLYELFKDFGPIKENGIQVRSSRGQSNAFGFIAFESATSVQNVLQAAKYTPFMLADRKLRVKEKEVDYNGSKSSVKPRECFKHY